METMAESPEKGKKQASKSMAYTFPTVCIIILWSVEKLLSSFIPFLFLPVRSCPALQEVSFIYSLPVPYTFFVEPNNQVLTLCF